MVFHIPLILFIYATLDNDTTLSGKFQSLTLLTEKSIKLKKYKNCTRNNFFTASLQNVLKSST